jgi:hypothetical protein
MTRAVRRTGRSLLVGVGIVVTGSLGGCEPAMDFWVTNASNQPLTVQERYRHPGQESVPLSPADWKATLQPGQKLGLQLNLSRGVCVDVEFLAYDGSGRLVEQDPTPICEDKAGHGNSWTLTAGYLACSSAKRLLLCESTDTTVGR